VNIFKSGLARRVNAWLLIVTVVLSTSAVVLKTLWPPTLNTGQAFHLPGKVNMCISAKHIPVNLARHA